MCSGVFETFDLIFLLAASIANEDQVFMLQRIPTLSSERIDTQMKKITRTIGTLMLAGLMLLSASSLTSCSDTKTPADDSTSVASTDAELTTPETKAWDALPIENFDNYEFTVITRPTAWSFDAMTSEEPDGDLLSTIVYRRQSMIEGRLGIKMTEVNSQNIATEVANSVNTSTHIYDICQMPAGTALQSYLRGEIVDISQIETIDLENPWWAQSINDTVNIGQKRYVVFGEGHLNYYCGFYIYAFNKELIKNNQLESPHDLVEAGTWTWEKMNEMMRAAAVDYDSNGVYDVSTDILGFTAHINHLRNLMLSSGETITQTDENGYPTYSGLTERYIDVYTRFLNKFVDDPTVAIAGCSPNRYEGYSSSAGTDNYAAVFNEGRALFQCSATYAIQSVRGLEFEYGLVIPPKYDLDQEDYVAPVYSYVEGIAVPSTNPDLDRTGLIVETLYAMSHGSLVDTLVGNILHYKCSQNPTDIKMINMVFEKGQIDIALANNFGNSISLLHNLHMFHNPNIASAFKTYEKKLQADIAASIPDSKD